MDGQRLSCGEDSRQLLDLKRLEVRRNFFSQVKVHGRRARCFLRLQHAWKTTGRDLGSSTVRVAIADERRGHLLDR
jgi:hypothetical protein